ncbi:MAG: DNA polymerase I [Clostridia bacterium]|nr:DNA polymerase I [Clostridia bacterium]
MNRLLLAIDGNSLLFQAYHAFFKANLTTRDGFPTGALKGFFTKLLELLKQEPSHVLVAFDVHQPTFRHEKYPDYKLGRKPADEDLRKQMPVVRELLRSMGVAVIECPGFEGDDILGTFARKAEAAGMDTLIATGDRDSFQLITDRTKIYYTKDNSIVDAAALLEKYGLTPDRMRDLKALMGDSSDHIPGVAGVGEKTALKLLSEYGDLESVLSHAGEVKGKLGERLAAEAENARFSYWLGTIATDAPVAESLDDCAFDFEKTGGAKQRLYELELNSIADRLPGGEPPKQDDAVPEVETIPVTDPEGMQKALDALRDCETIAVTAFPSLSFAGSADRAYVLTAGETLFDACMDENEAYRMLGAFIRSHKKTMLAFDAKTVFHRCGFSADALPALRFDAMLSDYLLQSNRPVENYETLCRAWLKTEKASPAHLFALYPRMERAIEENGLASLEHDVELPLLNVLYGMEEIGFMTDEAVLSELHMRFSEAAGTLEARIYDAAGERFNILSTKQLGRILFEKLGLPSGKKTKTGFSTDADTLEAIAPLHPIVGDVLQYRFLMKLDSTFVEGLLKQRDANGRIHSRFMQCVTATGRISSTEPNLQNIPVRTPEGREIRKAFIPSEGNVLVGADYSQIELRLLAHISGDESFIAAFNSGEDIHARTAAEVFHVPLENVTSELRSAAKAVNFGIVYGISDFGLARNLGVSVPTAAGYIRKYFERYPKVQAYLKESVARAKERGCAETLFGRKRPLPELSASNYNVRQFGERVAMNMPIQGTAADVIKIAMVRVDRALRDGGFKARLVLQIHDELIVDTPREEAERVERLMQQAMEGVADFSVRLVAEAKCGESWFETK